MSKILCLAFALSLFACSASSSEPETPGTCGPSSCPLPPSAPDPDGTCHRAIMNLVRVGLFRLAEVDPPSLSEEPSFCKIFEEKGYDLNCVSRARSVLEVSECKKAPDPGSV